MPSSNVIQPMPLRSALSIFVRPPSSRSVPTSLIFVVRVTVPAVEGGRRGHHLEHGARFVDVRDDRVDEAARRRRGDRPVVVGVVRRVGRLGVDLAGVRVHDDGRHALGLVGDPGRQQLLLEGELQARRRSSAAGPRRGRRAPGRPTSPTSGPAARVALGEEDARRAGQLLLVELLDAVLARRSRGSRSRAGARRGSIRDRRLPAGRRAPARARGRCPTTCLALPAWRMRSASSGVMPRARMM